MTITAINPASSYGMPVILDDAGVPMDYADGIRAIRRQCALSTTEFGALCGVSRRTVEGWEQGRMPSAAALNAIARLLMTATVQIDWDAAHTPASITLTAHRAVAIPGLYPANLIVFPRGEICHFATTANTSQHQCAPSLETSGESAVGARSRNPGIAEPPDERRSDVARLMSSEPEGVAK